MELQINKETEVNKNQYNFIKTQCSHLIAYRFDNNKYYIKPLLFMGNKKVIQNIMNKLN